VRSLFTYLFLFSCFSWICPRAQNVDSLRLRLLTVKEDTAKAKLLGNLGFVFYRAGNFDSALYYILEGNKVAERSGDKKLMGRLANNLANIYRSQNNFPAALQNHLKALKIRSDIGDSSDIALSLMNIGIVYADMKDPARAREYYTLARLLKERMHDRLYLGALYNNLGNNYADRNILDTAEIYFYKAYREKELDADVHGMALSAGLIANNYDRKGNFEMALLWYDKSLKGYLESGDAHGIAITYNNLGAGYYHRNRFREAEEYFLKAQKAMGQERYLEVETEINKNLSDLYEKTGRPRQALTFFKRYIASRDSIFNEANTKKLVQEEMKFEFDKKEAAAQLEQEKKDAVAQAEQRRQRIILFSISGFGLLVLGFAIFAYRSFLQKKKANVEIGRQKHLIEEKQKEILDSIYYARRIQRCLIPTEKQVYNILKKLKGEA